MKFFETPLKDAYVIEPEPFKDSRGMFLRVLCKRELAAIGQCEDIVQVNHSVTEKPGTLRGMHFQKPPKAEAKYVKCIKGAVYDVIVDIRKGSPTFLKWHGETLTSDNMRMMYVPKGFAHGYQIQNSTVRNAKTALDTMTRWFKSSGPVLLPSFPYEIKTIRFCQLISKVWNYVQRTQTRPAENEICSKFFLSDFPAR